MYLDICQHPQRVKIDGRFRYVPCGKCSVCLNRKSSVWINRIDREFQCHPYAFFVTLTYDNAHLPLLYLDSTDVEHVTLVDMDSSECFIVDEIKGFKPSSRLYVSRRKNIPYLRVKDLQDFIKRLRFYISNYEFKTIARKSKLRYCIAGEYGPTAYRPHWHCIFFIDSREVARRFSEFIDKSWKLGYVDFKCANAGSAKYIARYINSVSSLPLVYSLRALRPRLIVSKCPPIGSLSDPSFLSEQLFYGGYKEVSFMDSSGKVHDVPVWRYLEHKLFPKIQSFSNFCHSERVTLYGISSWCGFGDFESFVEQVREYCLKYDTFVTRFLSVLLQNDSIHSDFRRYSSLKALFYTSCRVVSQARIFRVSLDFYVYRIEQYYSMKELSKLKQFYEFQQVFSATHSCKALFYLYEDWEIEFNNFVSHSYDVRVFSSSFANLLVSVGFDLTMSPLDWSIVLGECQRYRWIDNDRMSQISEKILSQSRKTKKRNDYALEIQSNYTFNLLKDYE